MSNYQGGDDRRFEPLTPEQQRLVEQHLNLARSLAWKSVAKKRRDFDVAFSGACIGLIRASQTWDCRISKFTTYATIHIRNEITLSLRADCRHRMCQALQSRSMQHCHEEDIGGEIGDVLLAVQDRSIDQIDSADWFDDILCYFSEKWDRREILRMVYAEGMDCQHVADRLGISRSWVWSQLEIARDRVRKIVERQDSI